jgi:Tfp pilus assembly protein PilE
MNHSRTIGNRIFQGSRCGSMMVELLACGALLGVVLSTAIPTLRWAIHQRKFTDEREVAMLEVDNLMERVTALDWNELTTERAGEFRLSAAVAAQLPESRLAIAVEPDADDASAKIVRINLTWDDAALRPAPPVRLTAWVYRRDAKPEQQERVEPN